MDHGHSDLMTNILSARRQHDTAVSELLYGTAQAIDRAAHRMLDQLRDWFHRASPPAEQQLGID